MPLRKRSFRICINRFSANIIDNEDSATKRENQNLVRTLGAIPAVLAGAGALHSNQIRNWAIQAIKQLTDGNSENQKEIEDMKKIASVENSDVTVDRVDGKFHFKRIQR